MSNAPMSVKSGGYSFRKGKNQPKAEKSLRSIQVARATNGGFTAEHSFNNSGPEYTPPEEYVFGPKDGKKLMAHLSEHLGLKTGAPEE